ncbi:MAG: hypothetical protein FWD34_10000 [Oscillospiraceae bacterium]|nr:hypothetical protein [Oscillospiraceae bacterium]
MSKQLKYAARTGLDIRLIALGVTVVLNVVFGILGMAGITGEGWQTAAVSFSAFSLVAILVVSIIVLSQSYMSVYQAPLAHTTLLTPVKRWKIILSRIITIVVLDLFSWVIGITGIVWQALILAEDIDFSIGVSMDSTVHVLAVGIGYAAVYILAAVIGYTLFVTLVFYIGAIEKCLFAGKRLGKLMGIGVCLATIYLINLTDLLMAPFAHISRHNVFFTVTINPGINAGLIALMILYLIKVAALFLITAKLTERKINL